MTEKTPQERLDESIRQFLEIYKILSPEARISFEIEIIRKTKDMDERTQKLYLALIKAAKDDRTVEETIKRMHKSQ